MKTDTAIYFYSLNNKFSYMSNFYKVLFENKYGVKFNCSEQYFMYNKCILFDPDNDKLIDNILSETSPTKIKRYGRQVKHFDENIWREKRYNIMLRGLRYKFSQNTEILNKLSNTGDKTLYEASKFDKIWGIGYDAASAQRVNKSSYGENLLGRALMQIRDELG